MSEPDKYDLLAAMEKLRAACDALLRAVRKATGQ